MSKPNDNLKNEKKLEYKSIAHTFKPVYDKNSTVLILGSFPSVKSREQGFFYGHPQNRFWKVVASICCVDVPKTIDEKITMLLRNNIAIWDVIESCDIIGSSDSSIQNVIPMDLSLIINNSKVTRIFANGMTAAKLYRKYTENKIGMPIYELPSTSPANAKYSLNNLIEIWKNSIIE